MVVEAGLSAMLLLLTRLGVRVSKQVCPAAAVTAVVDAMEEYPTHAHTCWHLLAMFGGSGWVGGDRARILSRLAQQSREGDLAAVEASGRLQAACMAALKRYSRRNADNLSEFVCRVVGDFAPCDPAAREWLGANGAGEAICRHFEGIRPSDLTLAARNEQRQVLSLRAVYGLSGLVSDCPANALRVAQSQSALRSVRALAEAIPEGDLAHGMYAGALLAIVDASGKRWPGVRARLAALAALAEETPVSSSGSCGGGGDTATIDAAASEAVGTRSLEGTVCAGADAAHAGQQHAPEAKAAVVGGGGGTTAQAAAQADGTSAAEQGVVAAGGASRGSIGSISETAGAAALGAAAPEAAAAAAPETSTRKCLHCGARAGDAVSAPSGVVRESARDAKSGGGEIRSSGAAAATAEARVVRLVVCSGCRRARFCSEECSRAAWGSHKRDCRRAAAAAVDLAAGGGGGGGGERGALR